MSSKLIVLLGLFLAVTLLVSSEIATARDLAETTTNVVDPSKEAAGAVVNDAKYGGGYPGGGYGGYPGGGRGGNGGYPGGGRGGNGGYPGGGRGGNGGYPGGGRGGNGGYPGGGRGGRGGYCRYGCCGQSYNRAGCRCCSYAGEKADAEPKN